MSGKNHLQSSRAIAFIKLILVLLCGAGVLWYVVVHNIGWNQALGIAGSALGGLLVLLEGLVHFVPAKQRRARVGLWDVVLVFYRICRILLVFLVITLLVLAVAFLTSLDEIVAQHPASSIKSQVEIWIVRTWLAFGATGFTIVVLAAFGFWKVKATRFAESRVGVLKDLLIRVSDCLGNRELPLADRKREATRKCLISLLTILRLSPWSWLLRGFRRLRPHLAACQVLLFIPDPGSQAFSIDAAEYAEHTPRKILDLHRWIEENHHPSFLDEEKFRKAIGDAKGRKSRGWQRRYFNNPNRGKFSSAVGWVASKREVVVEPDASSCLMYDDSYLYALEEAGFSRPAVRWTEVRAFMACPIENGRNIPAVLFVSGNVREGFIPEDQEALVAVAKIIEWIQGEKER